MRAHRGGIYYDWIAPAKTISIVLALTKGIMQIRL